MDNSNIIKKEMLSNALNGISYFTVDDPINHILHNCNITFGISDNNNMIPEDLSYPLASVTVYISKIEKRDAIAVNAWRACLLKIFQSDMFGANNSSVSISANSSDLATYLKNILSEKYPAGNSYKEFTIYQSDDKPYAVYFPACVILPFITQTNQLSLEYKELVDSLYADYSKTRYFHEYLYFIINNLPNGGKSPVYSALNEFIEEIEDLLNIKHGSEESSYSDNSVDSLVKAVNRGLSHFVGDVSDASLFTDKLMIFKRTDAEAQQSEYSFDSGVSDNYDTWKYYRIDSSGELLTPVELSGFCGETGFNTVFVIPPFSAQFLSEIENKRISFISWNAEIGEDNDKIKITAAFKTGEVQNTVEKTFNCEDIVIAERLPYISMWPYVPCEWHEYFVSVFPDYAYDESFSLDYEKISSYINDGLLKTIDIHSIDIRLFDRFNKFSIDTYGLEAKHFEMLRTSNFPKYITFNIKGESFGCWYIFNKYAGKEARILEDKKCTLTLDFATTASVERLYSSGEMIKPDGPGSYLYDIYNPVWGSDEKREEWEIIQTYYLFGNKSGELDKIYTYGQINNAFNNGEIQKDAMNYVTGRAIIVSPKFIENIVSSSSEILSKSTIYSNLKWPKDNVATPKISEKDDARNNFILNVLTWGLLKAKLIGSEKIQINVSFPKNKSGDYIRHSLVEVENRLSEISGIDNISINTFMEAEANAAYMIDGVSVGLHNFDLPNPDNGFMIADIGGGTTDVAVCQYNDLSLPFDKKIKGETSIKYAGREIVDISLLETKTFKDLWISDSAVNISNAINEFEPIDIFNPVGNTTEEIIKRISSVGFILDNARLKSVYKGKKIADTMEKLKIKYLCLCWLLGVYVRKLSENNKIDIHYDSLFKIYFTGCASNGILQFCSINDKLFVDKCTYLANVGFWNTTNVKSSVGGKNLSFFSDGFKKNQIIEIIVNEEGYKGKKNKEAVAAGLAFLIPSEDNSLSNFNKDRKKIVDNSNNESENTVSFDINFNSEVKNNIVTLLNGLNSVESKTIRFNELNNSVKSYIEKDIFDDKSVLNSIENKVRDPLIRNEFFAVYILEILLDLNKTLFSEDKSKSLDSQNTGTLNIGLLYNDFVFGAQNLPSQVHYNLNYEIEDYNLLSENKGYNLKDKTDIERLNTEYSSDFNKLLSNVINSKYNAEYTESITNPDVFVQNDIIESLNSEWYKNGVLLSSFTVLDASPDENAIPEIVKSLKHVLAKDLNSEYERKVDIAKNTTKQFNISLNSVFAFTVNVHDSAINISSDISFRYTCSVHDTEGNFLEVGYDIENNDHMKNLFQSFRYNINRKIQGVFNEELFNNISFENVEKCNFNLDTKLISALNTDEFKKFGVEFTSITFLHSNIADADRQTVERAEAVYKKKEEERKAKEAQKIALWCCPDPNCRKQLNKGNFCVRCGMKKPQSILYNDSAIKWVCPTCGSLNKGNFCVKDGTKKSMQHWYCFCGNENRGKFCTACGQPAVDK